MKTFLAKLMHMITLSRPVLGTAGDGVLNAKGKLMTLRENTR